MSKVKLLLCHHCWQVNQWVDGIEEEEVINLATTDAIETQVLEWPADPQQQAVVRYCYLVWIIAYSPVLSYVLSSMFDHFQPLCITP